jgi:hypothetical protein
MTFACEFHGLDILALLAENCEAALVVWRLLQEMGILDLE